MDEFTTYDDELEYLSALLLVHNHNNDDYIQKKIVDLISDWFGKHSPFIARLDIELHRTINDILDDGIITDEETEIIIEYIKRYLRSHEYVDFATLKESHARLARDEKNKLIHSSELDKDFISKVCVLTGIFSRFPDRKEAEREIIRLGGKTASSISGATNMLICGDNGVGSGKLKQVETRNKQGQNIIVIDEQTFYKML